MKRRNEQVCWATRRLGRSVHPGVRRSCLTGETIVGIIAMAVLIPVPAVPAQAQERPAEDFQITRKKGYLEFVTRQREHGQESKVGTGNTRSKESIFEENLRLDVDGYAYHPNFLEFTLGGLFGLLQHKFEEQFDELQQNSGDNGTVLEFDLNGRFFKKKPYPGTVYAHRYRSLEPRPFLPSLETTTTNYGLTWQYVNEKTPTNIQFNDTEVRLNSLGGGEEGRQKNRLFRFETGYNFSDHNALSFIYSRESVEEKPFNLAYDADEVTVGHRLSFGDQYKQRLESEVNYRKQQGTFDIERFRWREIVRLQHTESLRSWYQFEAIDRTQGSLFGVPPIKERSYSLVGTLEHRLYESLISQLTAFGQTQKFEQGPQIDRTGVQASLDYRKKNPLGVLQANYRPRLQREEHTGGARDFEVFRESHTFRDPDPLTLSNPNINVGSIRITAENQITVFQRGRDYDVRVLPDRVEIRRVPTGQIADGQTVLIDYIFSSGGPFTLDTISQDVGLRQNFAFGLSPYYHLRWQDQTLSPQTATGVLPEDITSHIFGVEFERWSLRLGAEYEDYDSTINPFKATRLNGDYTRRFTFGTTANIRARWTNTRYRLPEDRELTFFTLEGRCRHPITKQFTVEGAARYRTLEDSLIRDKDKGIDVDLSLEWFLRQTQIKIIYRLGRFEDNFAKTDSSTLYVQVRRSF